MSTTTVFIPNECSGKQVSEYRAAFGLTHEEFLQLLTGGHPGGCVSVNQAGSAADGEQSTS